MISKNHTVENSRQSDYLKNKLQGKKERMEEKLLKEFLKHVNQSQSINLILILIQSTCKKKLIIFTRKSEHFVDIQ